MNIAVVHCPVCGQEHSMFRLVGEKRRCSKCGKPYSTEFLHEYTSECEYMKRVKKLNIDWIEDERYHV